MADDPKRETPNLYAQRLKRRVKRGGDGDNGDK